MNWRPTAVIASLALLAGACGDGYYACDPTFDPTCYDPYYDPWGYCDAYGCYGLSARTSATAFVRADGSGTADAATASAIARDLAAALAAARAVRRLGSPSGAGTFPPVDLGADAAPGLAAATYRLTLSPAADGVRWRLEAKAPGAPDEQFRTIFSGARQPGASPRAATGTFGLDLDALAWATSGAFGSGRLLGSLADDEQTQVTALRLQSFRPGESATPLPDGVVTATAAAPPSKLPATALPRQGAASERAALVPPDPPTAMPGGGP